MGILFIGHISCKSDKKPENKFNKVSSESSKHNDYANEPVDSDVEQITVENKKDILPNRIIDSNGKVGLITASTTKLDLAELYGKENITDTIVFSYEGIDVIGSQVSFENNNDNLYIVWNEDNLTPKTIIIMNENSNWRTKDGIGIGSTITEVEKANGKPFTIQPLEIDAHLAGTIQSWNSGNIQALLNLQFKITKDLPAEEYMKVMGGGLSNNILLKKLGLQVKTIYVSIR